jgi:hypothetical protein
MSTVSRGERLSPDNIADIAILGSFQFSRVFRSAIGTLSRHGIPPIPTATATPQSCSPSRSSTAAGFPSRWARAV